MSTETKPFGRTVLFYFLGFFGVMLAANLVMATLAVKTMSGLVTDHPYEKGLAYNKVVAEEKKQEALGWSGDIDYKDGKLSFVLRDHAGKEIKPESVKAWIVRPTRDGMDFTAELINGVATVKFPAEGLWEVHVDAFYDGHNYQQSRRIVVE